MFLATLSPSIQIPQNFTGLQLAARGAQLSIQPASVFILIQLAKALWKCTESVCFVVLVDALGETVRVSRCDCWLQFII